MPEGIMPSIVRLSGEACAGFALGVGLALG
jgi:hypothetical protein